jgi:hypothetical protein
MTEKKPYSQPQVFRVELNQEQAILSACSLSAMTAQNGGGRYCRAGGNFCKNASAAGSADSGARPS